MPRLFSKVNKEAEEKQILINQRQQVINSMTITHNLLISFDDNEKVKQLGYDIKYNRTSRKHEYIGMYVPDNLIDYLCVPIKIPFMSKNVIKQSFYIHWDNTNRTWETNNMSYDKIVKLLKGI